MRRQVRASAGAGGDGSGRRSPARKARARGPDPHRAPRAAAHRQNRPAAAAPGRDRERGFRAQLSPTDASHSATAANGRGILVRRRGVHQHRRAALADHPEIAAEGRIAGQRLDPSRRPSRRRRGTAAHQRAESLWRPSPFPCRGDLGCQAPCAGFDEVERQAERLPARHFHPRARAIRRATPHPPRRRGQARQFPTRFRGDRGRHAMPGGSSVSYGWTIAKLGLGTSSG